MTRADVGPRASTIQTRTVTCGIAFVSGETHFVTRFAGTCFRCGANSVEASIRTNRLTARLGFFISRFTLAHSRRNTLSSGAIWFTLWHTLADFVHHITFVTFALIRGYASPCTASTSAPWNTKFMRLIQLESVLAHANVQLQVALAIVAPDRARRDTLSLVVVHKVRIAGASVRSHAEPIVARLFADRITLAEVVNVPFVPFAAHLNSAQRWIRPISGRNLSVLWFDQCDGGHLIKTHSFWNCSFGFIHEPVKGTL